MSEIAASATLLVVLFAMLAGGIWVGLTLAGVAWFGMAFFTARAAGDAMAITIWGSTSSWTLTALPLFVWMGEILYRTNLSSSMFRGLAPWMQALPGAIYGLLGIAMPVLAIRHGRRIQSLAAQREVQP